MKRFWLIPVLSLTALLVGCSYDGDTIRAEVPGGYHGQVGAATTNGSYSLFHVTEFDKWGAPTKTERVTTITLKQNEELGFRYETADAKRYDADATSDVIAYAGNFKKNLGPIKTLNDHWYWANPDDWDGYWSMRPERVLAKRASMY